jgi:hypothetical protein
MEIRNANILFNKNGHGSLTTRITLPVPFVRELGFNEDAREALIICEDNQIIIRKKEKDMILIKKRNVSKEIDYELENDIQLFSEDWNTEVYGNGWNPVESKNTDCEYRPVYRFQLENKSLDEVEENSDEWDRLNEIIGFEEF